MADFNLITILPPQQISGVSSSAVSSGATSQGAPVLSSTPPGTLITGFVVNRDASGNPILRTDKGDITFQSNFFLKIGSEVVIRLAPGGGTPQAHIITVDGQPPEVAQGISSFAGNEDIVVNSKLSQVQSAGQLNTATAVNIPSDAVKQPVTTITGTLITQHAATPAQAQAAGQPAVGTELTLKVLNLESPAATPTASTAKPASIIPQATSPTPGSTVSYATYARAAGQVTTTATPSLAAPASLPVETIAAPAGQPSITVTEAPATNTIAVSGSAPATTPPQQSVSATGLTSIKAQAIPEATAQYLSFTNAVAASSTNLLTARELPSGVPYLFTEPHIPASVQSLVTGVVATPGTVVISPATPQATAPNALTLTTPLQPGSVITAPVIGHEPTGEVLLQTPAGIVRLQPEAVVPPGSTITFEIAQIKTQSLPNILPNTPAPLTELAQQWGSLQQIFSLLSGRSTPSGLEALLLPAAGQMQFSAPAKEVTGKTISNGLLLFIAALRGGNFRDWIGLDNASLLEERGDANIYKKAAAEFRELARQYTEAPQGHWQPLFFPVAVDGNLQQVRLYVKRDRRQGGNPRDRKQEEDTRFVIEVDLTQLGELQMDGFVRKNEKDTQFDMIIRSLVPLSQEIQEDILRIYTNTGALTGYKGSLSFQSVREFPVNPMEEIAQAPPPVIV